MLRSAFAATALTALMSSAAFAATLEYSDSVALQLTNFSDTASVAQFDPTLGTLNSVMVTLEGVVNGSARGENIGPSPVQIGLNLSATVSAALGATTLVTVIPTANQVFNASAFDGTLDFGGTSGATYDPLSGSETDSVTLTDAGDLAAFLGNGTIDFTVAATGSSFATGGGNVVTAFNTNAGGTVTVKYDYTELAPIPLPAGGVLLLGGLFAAAGLRMRRKA